jgi:hypothetical protein
VSFSDVYVLPYLPLSLSMIVDCDELYAVFYVSAVSLFLGQARLIASENNGVFFVLKLKFVVS